MASAPTNNVDPLWVRRTLCEDLAEIDRKSGRLPDTETIEQVVAEDIRLFQASERIAKPVDNKARKAKEMAYKHEERRAAEAENRAMGLTNDGLDKGRPAHDLAAKLGYRLISKPVPQTQPGQVSRRVTCDCGGWRCKDCKLYARIQELCKPEHGSAPRDLRFEYKDGNGNAYAHAVVNEAYRRGRGQAEYKGKPDKVCDAILRRKLEDIADLSNAHPGLGNWYVN